MTNMQAHLDELISENSRLQENEQKMRETYEQVGGFDAL